MYTVEFVDPVSLDPVQIIRDIASYEEAKEIVVTTLDRRGCPWKQYTRHHFGTPIVDTPIGPSWEALAIIMAPWPEMKYWTDPPDQEATSDAD